jgi:hypothetical protein
MGNTEDPRLSVYRTFSSHRSDPARLCCALTRLSQALAPSVPQAERRIDYLRCLRGGTGSGKTTLRLRHY